MRSACFCAIAKADAAFKAMVLAFPSEGEIGMALRAEGRFIDPDGIYAARKAFILALARHLQTDLRACHARLKKLDPRATDGVSMGKRSLKNLCLAFLAADENEKTLAEVFAQATKARNTDRSNRGACHSRRYQLAPTFARLR